MTTSTSTPSLRDLQNQAASLYKEKKYREALAIYEQIAREYPASINPWDGFRHAECLRRLKRMEEAEALCRKFLAANPEFPQLRNTLGWTLYDRWLKPQQDGEKAPLAQQIRTVQEICSLTPQGQYSPCAKAVLKLADALKETSNGAPADRIAWLKRLSAAEISLDTFMVTDETGVQREFASDRERYYAHYTDALFMLGRWQECIDACAQALAAIPKFHYDNEIWIPRRAALSCARMGDVSRALDELKSLLKKKKTFFLLHEIAELLLNAQRVEEALPYAAQAALGNDAPEMKVKVYDCLGRIYAQMGRQEFADEHFLLQAAIYAQKGWRIDDALTARIANASTPPNEVDIDALGRRLVAVWSSAVDASRERLNGVIKRVGETNNGHLRGEDGKDYFFFLKDFRGPRQRLTIGAPVSFAVEEGFDKKKNTPALNAVDIRPAQL
ncbi:MAG: tetratricopeptide repeat protein [Chloroflexi bacterium]|nr:tetratricopeptide repeat protein [Chloroflexota bacterium]